MNKINDTNASGWQTFYNKNSEDGKKLSNQIQNGLNEVMLTENKKTPKSIENVYIVKNVEIPTTIVECGFLSNSEECNNLQQEKYQDRLAWGIYNGIINYFYENS
ncbi:Germination-specific N-acetylmuramoyl-L-alanine amidase precursor [compost metagenome]